MAWCESMKMKRKGLDGGGDDFCSYFPLSSPARKIRRLDADLNPMLVAGGPKKNCPSPKETSPPPAPVVFNPVSDSASGFWAASNSNCCIKPPAGDEEATLEEKKKSMAVVPWVPRQLPFALLTEGPQTGAAEMMEAEDTEAAATMEIESSTVVEQPNAFGDVRGAANSAQWQQHQHCMITDLPQSASSTPIAWYG